MSDNIDLDQVMRAVRPLCFLGSISAPSMAHFS
jgi:hypothetical protein